MAPSVLLPRRPLDHLLVRHHHDRAIHPRDAAPGRDMVFARGVTRGPQAERHGAAYFRRGPRAGRGHFGSALARDFETAVASQEKAGGNVTIPQRDRVSPHFLPHVKLQEFR